MALLILLRKRVIILIPALRHYADNLIVIDNWEQILCFFIIDICVDIVRSNITMNY